jgi:hypothetical protein
MFVYKLINEQKNHETRIRFAVNKLAILGFDYILEDNNDNRNPIWKEIVDIICHKKLFIIRDLLDIIVISGCAKLTAHPLMRLIAEKTDLPCNKLTRLIAEIG